MDVLLTCNHCGFGCKGLTLHLKYKHQQTPAEYRAQFPGAEIFSSSVRQQMKENSFMLNNTGSFETRYGKEKADKIKADIGAKSGAARKGKKRPGQGEAIKLTWKNKRVEWTAGIRAQAQSEPSREKQRQVMKRRIERDGYHLARGKETRLEKFIRTTFEGHGYETIKQKGTKKETLGTVRFFDLWVPALNLVIECDGEYWHRTPERIEIDLSKNKAALLEGYRLLRVSDQEFSKRLDNADALKLDMILAHEDLEARADNIVKNRLLKIKP